ncbi:DarT ssDNA thymidine ADP-ribosyltransferase family protein [Ralstonia solanacearum species complex bacterium KE056]|uniref:DarT ssDNA thymidine ADP-ribosyltransferase family protein n=1 Tax=Ralstonia solanacearum species complex bacterium KE056 TaxID=3119585 RepID=UPI002FC346D3
MSQEAIKQLASRLQIPFLVHFTRATNLPSIIQHGLYPISRIAEIGVDPQINDQYRWDGRPDGVSVSIAFPNCKMFYKYRRDNDSVDWVVLGLNPEILWKKKCAFCCHNAADTRISFQSLDALTTEASFRGMFDDFDDGKTREEQRLKPHDPTDVQAEVMVLDVIEPGYIYAAAFNSTTVRDANAPLLEGMQVKVFAEGQGMFASRSYVR